MPFDLIGDVHGSADQLCALLTQLGYEQPGDAAYRHPAGRRVIFLGDYVDRGPGIVAVLRIVRAMVEAGQALALMGNHEYNAVALDHYVDGEPLRDPGKRHQHACTIEQMASAGEDRREWLEWMRQLPLWHEEAGFRAVHACWDEPQMAYLQSSLPDRRLRPEHWNALADRGSRLSCAVECALKGKEAPLPGGLRPLDTEGQARGEGRFKWWPESGPLTWRRMLLGPWKEGWPELAFDEALLGPGGWYPAAAKPVFFGHYKLSGTPGWQAGNICCLDYGAPHGALVAYRLPAGEVTGGSFHAVAAPSSA